MAKLKIGEMEILALTDGFAEFPAETFPGTYEEHIDALVKAAGKAAIETHFNAFVVRNGNATVLIDAGLRDLMGPNAGALQAELAAAGIAPGDVTHLIATHIHPDHVAGAITPEGAAVFENAEVFVTENDLKYFVDPGNFTTAPEMLTQWHQLAVVFEKAYGPRITPVADNADILPGISLMPLPGHTPGHVGVRVSDGAESFVHVGDIVHAQDLQLADPEIAVAFDMDADTARITRKRVLDMLANDGTTFSGGHILAPKFAKLEAAGTGYRLIED